MSLQTQFVLKVVLILPLSLLSRVDQELNGKQEQKSEQ